MMQPLPPVQHSVPAAYAEQLVQLVRRWDVTADELLTELGLSESDLEDPHGRVPLQTFAALIERARLLTGEPGLGFYLGLQKRISVYGYLGFAAMSAASVREALALVVRYTPMLTTSISLRLQVEGRMASLILDERADMHSARDVTLISLIVGMRQIGEMLTGRALDAAHADLAIAEPAYFHRFRHLLPDARFGQPVTQVVFDASFLDLPLAQADRAALQLAREQCERALDALGYDGDFVEQVRRDISKGESFRSLDEVAASVRISPRTLKRRLAAQGVSFSSLLDRERRERALLLLQAAQVPLEEVAGKLGYSTLSNFVRAFRRWTGRTPAAYRRARVAPAPPLRALRQAPYASG
jgi:AraC-like DNA-binding protein